MKQITQITAQSRQKMILTTEDGKEITFSLTYRPTQRSWYFDLVYSDFTFYGCKLVNSLNILRRYRKIIPFGISCRSIGGIDPFMIDDFSRERSVLFLLTKTEVENLEKQVYLSEIENNTDD